MHDWLRGPGRSRKVPIIPARLRDGCMHSRGVALDSRLRCERVIFTGVHGVDAYFGNPWP